MVPILSIQKRRNHWKIEIVAMRLPEAATSVGLPMFGIARDIRIQSYHSAAGFASPLPTGQDNSRSSWYEGILTKATNVTGVGVLRIVVI
jgi:hypothetical protein